ncbi:diguanylate cyclase [bacterium]|nr:diguanylate cyclase [bacterium]
MAMSNNTSLLQNKPTDKEAQELALQLETWAANNTSLLEVLLDAYCVVDLANNIVAVNTAFTVLVGESERKIRKNPQLNNFLKTEFCPSQCPTIQVITSERFLRLDEVNGSTKISPHLKLTISGVPIFSLDQKLLGCLLNIRDVTAESGLQIKYDEKKTDSVTDGLTRLYNKVFTEESLKKALKSGQRLNKPVSVMMGDVDHFKHVNDHHGHQAGDYVLATVAQLLKGEARESDIAGRFGGEEFVVVLNHTDLAGAYTFAERFRKRLESTQVIFAGKHIPLTISLGTSTFTPADAGNFDSEVVAKKIVAQADSALYKAKASGRNRTVQFESIPNAKETENKTKK